MIHRLVIALAAIVLICPAAATAQIVGSGVSSDLQASWNTLSAGAVSQRAPGNMVSSAVAAFIDRRNDAISQAANGPTITETEPPISAGQVVKIEAINAVFTPLNSMLALLNEAIRASAGLLPLPDSDGAGTLFDLLGNISGPGS